MSKKRHKEKARKKKMWRDENANIMSLRSSAPEVKRLLRQNGCDLPFYDFLDSLETEFNRIAAEARSKYPTLLGIHEVDEETYHTEHWWGPLGYQGLAPIGFNRDEEFSDYGIDNGNTANMAGITTAFRDGNSELKTIVAVRKHPKLDNTTHKESKYLVKICALAHEIGHVHDIENGINFDVVGKKWNLIEGEIFANLYGLDLLAKRQLVHSYEAMRKALEKAANGTGYISRVGRGVTDRLPSHQLIRWQETWSKIHPQPK